MTKPQKKRGPKPADNIDAPMRRVNIHIDDETHQILRKSGIGSVSAGIRVIVKSWAKNRFK